MPAPGPHPGTSALGRPPGGSMDWGEQERELQEVTRQLSNYVLEGSKEWKNERRKANNRLYQRLKRNGRHIFYGEHEIRVDMLVKLKDKAEAKKAEAKKAEAKKAEAKKAEAKKAEAKKAEAKKAEAKKAEANKAWLLKEIESEEPYLVPPKTPKGTNMPDWWDKI